MHTCRAPRSPLVFCALLLMVAGWSPCYQPRVHFGGSEDRTVVHQEPRKVPREQWAEGLPAYDVVFEGVYLSRGNENPAWDETATGGFGRLLHDAGVFASMQVPDPENPKPISGGRKKITVRMDVHYADDKHGGANLTNATLAPGKHEYRFDLRSTMRLKLIVPGRKQPVTYQTATALTRFYRNVNEQPRAERMLYNEVDKKNLIGIIHLLRSDSRLRQRPDAAEPSSGAR